MRFLMVDRIVHAVPGLIRTRKTVSFEEYSLLKPWGRKGVFPESLLLQVAVESASLLQEGRGAAGVLAWVEGGRFLRETRPGSVVECEVEAQGEGFRYTLADQWGPLASGHLGLADLPDCRDPQVQTLARAAITGAAHGAS